jgi:PAS domain S-box-containing protein
VDTILLLGQNLALLIASAYLYGLVSRRFPVKPTARNQVLYGFFFGAIAIISMQLPLVLETGVILDGRVMVVTLAAPFGGVWASLTAGLIASIYRYTLGGPGAYPGIAAILLGVLVGAQFVRTLKNEKDQIRPLHFILLGGVNSVLGLLFTFFLPDWDLALRVAGKILLPITIYYPLCSLLLGSLFLSETHRQNTERALLESEERFRLLVETNPNGILVHHNKVIQLANPAVVKLLGINDPEGILGRNFYSLVAPEDREKLNERRKRVVKGETLSMIETRFIRDDGRIIDVEITGSLVPLGKVRAVQTTFRDISAQKQAQKALAESEERFRSIVDNSHDGIYIIDDQKRITYANPEMCNLTGYSEPELVGALFNKIVTGKGAELTLDRHTRRMAGEEVPSRYTFEILRKDGEKRWVEVSASIFDDSRGRRFNVAQFLDVTDRKMAEAALQQSEERFRAMVESSPNGVLCHRDGEIILANPAAARILAAEKPDDLIGLDFYSFMHPDQLEKALERKQKLLQTGGHTPLIERRLIRLDGKEIEVEATGSVVALGDGKSIQSVIRDITLRKKAQRELAESEERFSAAFHASPIWATINTLDEGRYLAVNQAFCNITGYSREEVLGRTSIEVGLWPDPGIREPLINLFKKEGSFNNQEVPRRFKDGSLHTLLWSADPIEFAGQSCMINTLTDITERKKTEMELALYREQLEDLVKERTHELKLANDQLEEEVKERKSAESELRQYADTQKVLIQEVNHRVKNNLAAIIGMVHMEQDRAEAEKRMAQLPFLQDLVGRIEGLATVHRLLSASGWRPLQLSELCEQVVSAALQGVPLNKKIEVKITPSRVRVDNNQAHHLTLVLNELATNSMKYALDGRPAAWINIEIKQKKDVVEILFKDDGPGYPEQIIRGDLSSTSIGFELIRGITRQSLNGRTTFRNDNGACTLISFRNNHKNHMERLQQ